MDSAPITLATVGMALVAALVSLGSGILNFLEKRDSRRFDARLVTLEQHKEICDRDRVEWQTARKAMQEEFKAFADRCWQAEQKMAKIEGELRASENAAAHLREEVSELRGLLYEKR